GLPRDRRSRDDFPDDRQRHGLVVRARRAAAGDRRDRRRDAALSPATALGGRARGRLRACSVAPLRRRDADVSPLAGSLLRLSTRSARRALGPWFEVRPLAWSLVAVAGVTAGLSLVHYAEKPSGVQLLAAADEKSVWKMPRWEVQSTHDPPLAPLWRYLDDQVPAHTTLALALGPNDFGFPPVGPHLERRIVLVASGSSDRDTAAQWLLANVQRAGEIDTTCWAPRLKTERGTLFQATGCG